MASSSVESNVRKCRNESEFWMRAALRHGKVWRTSVVQEYVGATCHSDKNDTR